MVWVSEKKVFYHRLDLGYESVRIPLRVTFEFQVQDGTFVRNSLSFQKLFNKPLLEKRYPKLDSAALEKALDATVKHRIVKYLKNCGYIEEDIEINTLLPTG